MKQLSRYRAQSLHDETRLEFLPVIYVTATSDQAILLEVHFRCPYVPLPLSLSVFTSFFLLLSLAVALALALSLSLALARSLSLSLSLSLPASPRHRSGQAHRTGGVASTDGVWQSLRC